MRVKLKVPETWNNNPLESMNTSQKWRGSHTL